MPRDSRREAAENLWNVLNFIPDQTKDEWPSLCLYAKPLIGRGVLKRQLIGSQIDIARDPSQAGKYHLSLAIKTCLEIKLNPRPAKPTIEIT